MTDKFEPTKYRDEYHDKVLAVIQAKVEGVSPAVAETLPTRPAKVIDLMEVLKQSLTETQKKAADKRPSFQEKEPALAGSGKGRSARSRKDQ